MNNETPTPGASPSRRTRRPRQAAQPANLPAPAAPASPVNRAALSPRDRDQAVLILIGMRESLDYFLQRLLELETRIKAL